MLVCGFYELSGKIELAVKLVTLGNKSWVHFGSKTLAISETTYLSIWVIIISIYKNKKEIRLLKKYKKKKKSGL